MKTVIETWPLSAIFSKLDLCEEKTTISAEEIDTVSLAANDKIMILHSPKTLEAPDRGQRTKSFAC
jgi:hypothetical protein